MVDVDVETGRKDRGRGPGGFGCIMSLLQIVAFMAFVGVVIWALNPGMAPDEAARQGVLWGGGILMSFCFVPTLLFLAVVGGVLAFLVWRSWRRRRRARPTVIDIRE